MTADAVYFSLMVGLGETYVPAFALAVGLGEIVAGLVATLPMLVGAIFQTVTPFAVRRLRSYRRWVVVCAVAQAASFLPLVVGAAVGRISLVWLGFATVTYWSFGMAAGPAWNAWVTSLVPTELRSRFFARRTRAGQAALFAAILAAGFLLDAGRHRDAELWLFAVIFAMAAFARLISSHFLSMQSEAPDLAAGHRTLHPEEIFSAVRQARSVRVFAYLLGVQAAVHVAAPFFTPYMLGPLSLSYTQFMVLTAAAFLARVAVLPLLGRMAHHRGTGFILWWGAIGIVPLPVLWLVSHEFGYLLVLQIFSGTSWAALELATLLSFFERIPDEERASVLTLFNVGNAIAIGLGALLGSWIFLDLEGSTSVYVWLFAISSTGRLLVLAALRGTRPAHDVGNVQLRTLAVRPSAGLIARPILATLDDDEPAPLHRAGDAANGPGGR